ncbi:MAG: isochorismatase family protein [Peptococcaceae bacterium]|nr:isochorismatase family protein [Peptococcaceae bacterium]
MREGQEVIDRTNILLETARTLTIPVLATEQYPRGLGTTIADILLGPEIHPYEKLTFTGCTQEVIMALENIGRKKVIVAGMETHVCVFQTVRDLLSLGYQVFVVRDAVCSRSRENYLNGLALMKDMGAVITNSETVVFDLMKEAGTAEFKILSKLIK